MNVASAALAAMLAVQGGPPDSLRLLAREGSSVALVAAARAGPQAVRDAVTDAFRESVRTPAQAPVELAAARTLASAFATAFGDSLLVRQVALFAARPGAQRASKVWADSVRRAGVVAYSHDGPAAAVRVWRLALARYAQLADTAGVASVLANIGAGHLALGALDSAESTLKRSRTLASAIAHRQVEANAAVLLAGIAEDRGQPAAARRLYAEAVSLAETVGDTRAVSAALNNLGLLARAAGDAKEARRHFEEALEHNRAAGLAEVAATNIVNLAGLAALDGDLAGAQRHYEDALATWRAADRQVDAAFALQGLGELALRRGSYPTARSRLGEALAIYARTGPVESEIAVRATLAAALRAQGDVQGAIDALRLAEDIARERSNAGDQQAGLVAARGDLAVQLNDLDAAAELYARAERLHREDGDASGQAYAQDGLAFVQAERGNTASALALVQSAIRLHRGAGNARDAALARLTLASTRLAAADTAGARRDAAGATGELARLGDTVATAAGLAVRGDIELGAGLPAAAGALYEQGLALLGNRAAPDAEWRLRLGLGRSLVARRLHDAASRELREAIAAVERSTTNLRLTERRTALLADRWDAYALLASVALRRSDVASAFEASERLRARETLEVVSRGRIAAPQDTADALVTREQDLRAHIDELTRGVHPAASGTDLLRGPDVSAAGVVAREALLAAQREYAATLIEIRERVPEYASLVASGTASWRDVARRLGRDEAFISYLVADSTLHAFVVRADTVHAHEIRVGRQELGPLVAFARGVIEQRTAQSDSLWRAPLRRLHAYLIAPLIEERSLEGARRLVIAPHAELHYAPFAALLDGATDRFLVESYDIAETPSASVWLAAGDRVPVAAGEILAVAPRPDVLPATRREVRAVAGGRETVLIGSSATETAVRDAASDARIIHFATLGVLNKQNPLFSYLVLARDAAHDGRLEVHEVLGLRLNAELVILSACQTALGSGATADVPPGDDWIGLTRAFLHAGARGVVASLWAVDDEATADLLARFHDTHERAANASAALASAQRAQLRVRRHPFYWAGFTLVEGRATSEGARRETK